MDAYWWYILKASICIIAFYTFYALVLRKCTFFMLNRLYLVSALILSFVIPAMDFSITVSQPDSILSNMVYSFLYEPEYNFFQFQKSPDNSTTFNYLMLLPVIYFAGMSVLFFRFLFSILKIFKLSRNSETSRIGRKNVFQVDSNSPFSFFNLVFLPKGENNPLIVAHEMAHVRQCHWLDLVLMEIVTLLLWFNPFVFFYRKSLKLQHEYLADAYVVKDDSRVEGYLSCMLKQIKVFSFGGITSQFYCKTIKKRIVMIAKDKTPHKYLGVYILILPLVSLMLSAFSLKKEILIKSDGTVSNLVNQEPSLYPLDIEKVKRIAGYGEWTNPLTKKKGFHYGIDFAIAEGEEIVSTADGVVAEVSFDPAKGNYILIRHSDIFSTFYSHLKSISAQVGDQLEKGRIIGYSGNSGSSTTGPHLHYEVLKEGVRVNPKDYLP